MSHRRQARLRALAKINLDLRVLGLRPDGYHELRTIFQTISLADTLEVAFTPARRTSIELADEGNIPDNLVVRAARLVLEAMRVTGRVEMRLVKRIPVGAGLGGGSSAAGVAGAGGPGAGYRTADGNGPTARQRRTVFPGGRPGGGHRPGQRAVSLAGRRGSKRRAGGVGHPRIHGRGVPPAEPWFDKRIAAK